MSDTAKWWFVDMETMGFTPDSLILSVGILCIDNIEKEYTMDELKKSGIYIKVNKKEQQNIRTISKNTLEFWKTQKNATDLLTEKNVVSLSDTYKQILSFVLSQGLGKEDLVWSKGLFDKYLIDSFCNNTIKSPNPFQNANWVDTKTALGIMCGDMNIKTKYDGGYSLHNALLNCIIEYEQIKTAIQGN